VIADLGFRIADVKARSQEKKGIPFCFFILDSEFWLLNSYLLWCLVLSSYLS
jgi:hypothetical protein